MPTTSPIDGISSVSSGVNVTSFRVGVTSDVFKNNLSDVIFWSTARKGENSKIPSILGSLGDTFLIIRYSSYPWADF